MYAFYAEGQGVQTIRGPIYKIKINAPIVNALRFDVLAYRPRISFDGVTWEDVVGCSEWSCAKLHPWKTIQIDIPANARYGIDVWWTGRADDNLPGVVPAVLRTGAVPITPTCDIGSNITSVAVPVAAGILLYDNTLLRHMRAYVQNNGPDAILIGTVIGINNATEANAIKVRPNGGELVLNTTRNWYARVVAGGALQVAPNDTRVYMGIP